MMFTCLPLFRGWIHQHLQGLDSHVNSMFPPSWQDDPQVRISIHQAALSKQLPIPPNGSKRLFNGEIC